MKITLFEDAAYRNLLPLVYFRPVWELRCGARTLAEKIAHLLESEVKALARTYLEAYYLNADKCFSAEDGERLFVNGRWLLDEAGANALQKLPKDSMLCAGDTLLAFYDDGRQIADSRLADGCLNSARILQSQRNKVEMQTRIIDFLWDAVNANGEEIGADYRRHARSGSDGAAIMDGVHMVKPEQISIAAGATIMPGVVIDATHGPVWIEEGTTVMANAVLEGPLYIGKNSRIKIAAKIYENTTIGPVCKVGGEVEGSIIHGYSNKQHDGFLGHAYLGEWVNLGADTNNSDLKNNYGIVTAMVNGRAVSTGSQFVGLMMGDHSKTAINTMFNTGTIVGVSSNVFGAGMPPKFVPSFSWGGADVMTNYRFEKATGVARAVMARRGIEFDETTEKLFEAVRDLAGSVEKKSDL